MWSQMVFIYVENKYRYPKEMQNKKRRKKINRILKDRNKIKLKKIN